jgi:hypothetical protein
MFGMIMLERNVPNLWTWTRAEGPDAGVEVVVAMLCPPVELGGDPHHMMT